ncbi:Uncharacterized protein APZ42_018015 [Daphnia magna]|uniref:Uncharacterized protein n=1 Tax=Daphnia magna TaxID=35525 RepID=A0A164ZH00_9CRUS|nr:Uncharacterized protein APZ42_018015 [Daphnia magna]
MGCRNLNDKILNTGKQKLLKDIGECIFSERSWKIEVMFWRLRQTVISVLVAAVHIFPVQSVQILLMVLLLCPIQQQNMQIGSGKLLALQIEKVVDVDQENVINISSKKTFLVLGGLRLCWKRHLLPP